MNNDLHLLVKDIPQDDLQTFIKNTHAKINAKRIVNKVAVDYSWVDVLDEAIPYLDTIIRNPRRFIVAEENVIPIEKTKKVSQESVKHLAVHTNLIQDVDEEGMVKPLKLLNIFREETIDLYENRFIYSLITNLHTFVREQLTYRDQSASNIEERLINYEANTTYKNHRVNISLNLVSKDIDGAEVDEDALAIREEKIKHISEILEDFMASKFMKAMANATPVRSPIRKTNVILKEQNFIKALELWEFLESYQIEKPVEETHLEENLTTKTLEKNYGMTYFLDYGILNNLVTDAGSLALTDTANLNKSVFEQASKFEVDESTLQKELQKEINKASAYKKEQKANAHSAYQAFIDNHNSRIRKANLLFR